MLIGDKIKVIETIVVTDDNGLHWTHDFVWDGIIIQITEAFVETRHARHAITHPYWFKYVRAYGDTYTKHYYHPDNKLSKIIF